MSDTPAYVYDAHQYRSFFEHEFTYLNGFRRNVARYAAKVAMILSLIHISEPTRPY